jgi:hypothetical protein
VTANAYILSTKRRIKDSFISSENAPKLTTAIWVVKNFPGVNPRTPNKGKEKRKEKGMEKGKGRRNLHLLSLIIYMPCMLLASGLNFCSVICLLFV